MIVYSSETTAPKPPQNQASLWIVSFGSDRDYVSIAKDTISQLQKLYPYANCLIYEPSDLPDYIRDYAKLYKIGYGYWLLLAVARPSSVSFVSLSLILIRTMHAQHVCRGTLRKRSSQAWVQRRHHVWPNSHQ